MEANDTIMKNKYYKYALWLSFITIGYNVVEGGIATWFGAEDETLALFGFGVDSFVEVISGIGIAHFVLRMKKNPDTDPDEFEITALRITGSTSSKCGRSVPSLWLSNPSISTTSRVFWSIR